MRMMKKIGMGMRSAYIVPGKDVNVQVYGGYIITEELPADLARQMQIRYGFINATDDCLPPKPVAKAKKETKAKRKSRSSK